MFRIQGCSNFRLLCKEIKILFSQLMSFDAVRIRHFENLILYLPDKIGKVENIDVKIQRD